MTDIMHSPTRLTAKLAPADRLLAAIRRVWAAFNKERRIRATLFRLNRLNDHALRDIGLERDDIETSVRSQCAGR